LFPKSSLSELNECSLVLCFDAVHFCGRAGKQVSVLKFPMGCFRCNTHQRRKCMIASSCRDGLGYCLSSSVDVMRCSILLEFRVALERLCCFHVLFVLQILYRQIKCNLLIVVEDFFKPSREGRCESADILVVETICCEVEAQRGLSSVKATCRWKLYAGGSLLLWPC